MSKKSSTKESALPEHRKHSTHGYGYVHLDGQQWITPAVRWGRMRFFEGTGRDRSRYCHLKNVLSRILNFILFDLH